MTTPTFGQRVRTKSGATGRYIGDGLALYVSAQDNDLMITEVNPLDGDPPSLTLPAPGEEACLAAAAGVRFGRWQAAPPTGCKA